MPAVALAVTAPCASCAHAASLRRPSNGHGYTWVHCLKGDMVFPLDNEPCILYEEGAAPPARVVARSAKVRYTRAKEGIA